MLLRKTKTYGSSIGHQVLTKTINQKLEGGLIIKLPFYFYIVILLFLLTFLINLFYVTKNYSFVFDNILKQSIKFTFFQAILSTIISIILGFILSICLYLSNFKRKIITTFLNFFFIAPVLFISYGVIFIHGSDGLLQNIFQFINLNFSYTFFGIIGIIYVTSYFNIALSANYFFRKLTNIPENYLKLMSANKISLYVALTRCLKPVVLNNLSILITMVLIFCISNFTIIYIFASSPLLTTIEMAIYQKISFEANISEAVIYGFLQTVIISLILIPTLKLRNNFQMITLKVSENYRIYQSNLFSSFFLIIFFLYFFSPCLVVIKGLYNFNIDLLFSKNTILSFLYSLIIAFSSLCIALMIAISSLFMARRLHENNSYLSNYVILSIFIISFVPSISLSAILFMINVHLNFILPNFLIVAFINSFLLTPLIFLFLFPKFMENNKFEKLRVLQFNISAVNRFTRIDFLKIKKELIVVSSSCFVLSMGDLTSITLFNSSSFKTVPYLISQLYSSYRYNDAFFILAIFVLFIISFLYMVNSLAYKNVKIR